MNHLIDDNHAGKVFRTMTLGAKEVVWSELSCQQSMLILRLRDNSGEIKLLNVSHSALPWAALGLSTNHDDIWIECGLRNV